MQFQLDQIQGKVIKVDDKEGTDPITKFLQGIIPGVKPEAGPQNGQSAPRMDQQQIEQPQQKTQQHPKADAPLKTVPIPPERPYNLDSNAHSIKGRPEAPAATSDAVKQKSPPRDKPAPPKGDAASLQELSRFNAYPSEKLSPVQQEAQKMAREFLAERDKKAALSKYEGRAREIMSHSDQAFFNTEKTQTPIIKSAEANYVMKNSLLANSIQEIHESMKELPKPTQEKLNKILNNIDDNGDNPVSRSQLKTLLKDNPDLLSKVNEGIEHRTEFTKADQSLTDAIAPLAKAAHDEVDARFIFQRMAKIAGDKRKADDYGEEGQYMLEHFNKIINRPRPEEVLDIRKA